MSRMPRLPLLLALAWAAVAAAHARAGDDAGMLSPFASGAGTRPLAMGGAFVAIADDAAAPSWNPAGLARVTRSGFELTHASPGLDARDESAALVVPSWRWGAAALTLRHFGVGGIERRDDRNVLLEDGLTDAETEVGVAWARGLGEAWSVGGAVKLQRHTLAGLGASAVGADAGVIVNPAVLLPAIAWLDGVSAGIAVRNLVEPALRLDRESVPDPRLWRAGLGWQGAIAGGPGLTVALDVDRSAVTGARVHAGAEVRIHPLLAMRLGVDRGRTTAGTGLRWRDFDIGYAFRDGALGPVHRIGLTRAFGPTVAASREAARTAEAAELQARLDDDFQRRRAAQLDDLLARAGSALASGAHERALELVAAAGTLDSTDARIAPAAARVERAWGEALEREGDYAGAAVAFGRALAIAPGDSAARDGERRNRAESERRAARDAGRRARFASALDAFVAGDLPAARRELTRLAAEDRHDAEAATMLQRVGSAIAARVAEHLLQARRSLEAGRWDEAARQLARARSLDPQAAGAADVEAALAARRAAPAPDPAPAPAAGADRREAEALFRRGLAAMSARRPDDAVRFWELALSADPGHVQAGRALNREYLVRGMDAYAAGRLDEAMGHWENAHRADPTDRRAAGFLSRARERMERTRQITGERR